MDLDRVAIISSVDGKGNEQWKNFNFQLGALSSALEHAIPEQMFVTPENSGEAVSAVKALQKAASQGQRICHITQAIMATALPNIRQNSLTMSEIRAALAVGKEVIVHTDPITVPGWKGAGYIITDPQTGAGAWKIGGGANGGQLDGETSVSNLISSFLDMIIPSASASEIDNAGKWAGRAGAVNDLMDAVDRCDTTDAAIVNWAASLILGFFIASVMKDGFLVLAGLTVMPLWATIFIFVFITILMYFILQEMYERDPYCR